MSSFIKQLTSCTIILIVLTNLVVRSEYNLLFSPEYQPWARINLAKICSSGHARAVKSICGCHGNLSMHVNMWENPLWCSNSFAGTAVKCWDCSSYTDPNCGDPFNKSTLLVTDCDRIADADQQRCIKIKQQGESQQCMKMCFEIYSIHCLLFMACNISKQSVTIGATFVVVLRAT